MKKIFNILAGVAVMASVVACDVEYDPIVIIPNPELNKTGLQTVNTISIYDEQETVINVARTAGLSKEMNMNVLVDQALLDEYNAQNGTSFEMLGSEYYTIPEEVFLAKDSLDVDFTVVTKPAAMVAGLGRTEASNYVLPLRIESPATGIDSKTDVISVLLRPAIADPKVTVEIPKQQHSLDFISVVHLSQVVDLVAVANFNTLDVNKIEFKPLGEAEVEAYNTANDTDYVLLTEGYEMTETFDAETMTYTSSVEFKCWTLDESNKYLLPVEAKSTVYGVEQKEIIYISVQMSQLKVWLSKTEMTTINSKFGVDVEINTGLENEMSINLEIDPSLVEAYNAANGTSYAAVAADKVNVETAVVEVGSKKASANVTLDMSAMSYDETKYLIPLVIKKSEFAEGTEVVENKEVIYVIAYNTIVGTYEKEAWRSNWHTKIAPHKGTNGLLSTNIIDYAKNLSYGGETRKYGIIYSYTMQFFFNIDLSKEIDPENVIGFDPDLVPQVERVADGWNASAYEDKAKCQKQFAEKPGSGCYALVDWVDRTDGSEDMVISNYSYINVKTGEVFIDVNIMGWSSPGSQINPWGNDCPLIDGFTHPGDLYTVRMYNKQMNE